MDRFQIGKKHSKELVTAMRAMYLQVNIVKIEGVILIRSSVWAREDK